MNMQQARTLRFQDLEIPSKSMPIHEAKVKIDLTAGQKDLRDLNYDLNCSGQMDHVDTGMRISEEQDSEHM